MSEIMVLACCHHPLYGYLHMMKKFILSIVTGLTSFLLINSVFAEDHTTPKAEKSAQAQIPSLTFYYYDG